MMEEIIIIFEAIFKIGFNFIGGSLTILLVISLIQLVCYRVFKYNIYKKLSLLLLK